MSGKITFLFLVFIGFSTLQAKEITQITGENPHYLISVTRANVPIGDIEIELFPDFAPKHCHNFDSLVTIKFYDGTAFHRVIPNFMIQGGDPNSKDKPRDTWGYGDPSQTKVPAEFGGWSPFHHIRGILSAARLANDINSATSQFFICVAPATHLDGKYSVYGQVVSGMDVADIIVNSPRDANNNPYDKIAMTIKKVEPTSVIEQENKDYKILVYLNSNLNEISFNTKGENVRITAIRIFDISGKVYFDKSYSGSQNLEQLKIPADNYPSGAYVLQLFGYEGKISTLKIVIE